MTKKSHASLGMLVDYSGTLSGTCRPTTQYQFIFQLLIKASFFGQALNDSCWHYVDEGAATLVLVMVCLFDRNVGARLPLAKTSKVELIEILQAVSETLEQTAYEKCLCPILSDWSVSKPIH